MAPTRSHDPLAQTLRVFITLDGRVNLHEKDGRFSADVAEERFGRWKGGQVEPGWTTADFAVEGGNERVKPQG